MTPLRELQQRFVHSIVHDHADAAALIDANGVPADRRLAIYRNNAREGFIKTLQACFPVIARLSGEDWFRQTACEYMRRHPSPSGNLHHVGERFSSFLDATLADTPFDYFADVARLEWAYQEVLVAADHPAFDVSALQSVAPDEYGSLAFVLHPAARVVQSRFPILAIWKANQPEALEDAASLRLDAGASRVLVIRRDDHVELRELASAEYALLRAFADGLTFAHAADAVLEADPAADLGAVLAHVMQLNVFVDFAVRPATACTC